MYDKLKKLVQALSNRLLNLIDRLPIDNKLIGAGVGYVLTALVTEFIGADALDDELFNGVTIQQAISAAGAAAGGWWTSNEATLLRKPPIPGFPVDTPEDFDPDHAPHSPGAVDTSE